MRAQTHHPGRVPCEEGGRGWVTCVKAQGPPGAGGQAWNRSPRSLRRNQPRRRLDLRLLNSRTESFWWSCFSAYGALSRQPREANTTLACMCVCVWLCVAVYAHILQKPTHIPKANIDLLFSVLFMLSWVDSCTCPHRRLQLDSFVYWDDALTN